MATELMDTPLVQVNIATFQRLIGGRNMNPIEAKKAKDFRALATVPTDARHRRVLAKEKNIHICRAASSVAALAAKASKQPKFVVKDVAKLRENAYIDSEVDIAIYPSHPTARAAYSHKVESLLPHYARRAWSWMVSYMIVLRPDERSNIWFPSSDVDTYSKPSPVLNKDTDVRLYEAASRIMRRQHRTHLFAFVISGPWVRAARFDRAGCIVSEPFPVVRSRMMLPNLLFRILSASRERQGFDVTVELASAEETAKLEAFTTEDRRLKLHWRYIVQDQRCFPLQKVRCPAFVLEDDQAATQDPSYMSFLISKPLVARPAIAGRCTRGYIAYDIEHDRLVFLKDQWRSLFNKHTELETYRRLHEKKVNYIATLLAGEEMQSQITATQKYWRDMRGKIHTRIVTKEIGLPLEDYTDAQELLTVIQHAMTGHKEAWEKAGVLHRDISTGNIMIDIATGRGFLNDWDLPAYAEDINGPDPETIGATGTWQFKSAVGQRYPKKRLMVSDDMESFVYLVLYMANRFHWHKHSPIGSDKKARWEVDEYSRWMFADDTKKFFAIESGTFQCNAYPARSDTDPKFVAAKRGEVPVRLKLNDDRSRPLLAEFLHAAYQLVKQHYETIDFKALKPPKPKPMPKPEPVELPSPTESSLQRRADLRALFGNVEPKKPRWIRESDESDDSSRAVESKPRKGDGPLATHGPLLDLLSRLTAKGKDLPSEPKYFDHYRGQEPARLRQSTSSAASAESNNAHHPATPVLEPALAEYVYRPSQTLHGGKHGLRVRISEDSVSYEVRVAPANAELPVAPANIVPRQSKRLRGEASGGLPAAKRRRR
ncbi:hypothetical protein PsYK624_025600 [Phanerochaete sordida]|uniref:Fungal-type protein kinase domain-containing protein n=1 Tax=Phanerochaete sordida TaxID=48140 RepID=A0A9P3G223_9APHY|nr:hypothetical protein PsYK624_025600 [Phanerochaete sordida]